MPFDTDHGKDDLNASDKKDVSRRTFLRTTAATGALLSPVLAAPAFATSGLRVRRRADTLRVGLIGCGGRGTGAAGQALTADPDVVLWSMGDMFSDRLDSSHGTLKENFSNRVMVNDDRRFVGFDAFQHVIDSGVDVVILTTPPHFRPQHLEAAIAADKHIFCEKPMAVDAPGARRVFAAAREADAKGLALMGGFCWRYSHPERATYKQIHDGRIGDVTCVHTTYHTSPLGRQPRKPEWSEMEFQLRNWWHFCWISGDHIAEQACHSIDKIAWAMNGEMPVKAEALGGRMMREGEESGNVYDHFTVIYEYANGVRNFHTCRQMPKCSNDNSDHIIGTKGRCYVNGWGPTHVIKGENPWSYEGDKPNMYQVEHNELFAAIRSGTRINDGEDFANSTMMSLLGRKAAYTGKTVTWEQALNDTEDLTPPAYEFGDVPLRPVPHPGDDRSVLA